MQGSPLSERRKIEHQPKPADLAGSEGILCCQGDGDATERDWMTFGSVSREDRPPVLEQVRDCRRRWYPRLRGRLV